MVKAYDLADLGDRLKGKGLVVVEAAAEEIYKELKGWLKDSAALSETKYDDLVISFIDQLDGIVLPQINKIDGAEG